MRTAHCSLYGGGISLADTLHLTDPPPWRNMGPCTETPLPWTEWLTHACENITLPQTSFAGGKYIPDDKFYPLNFSAPIKLCTLFYKKYISPVFSSTNYGCEVICFGNKFHTCCFPVRTMRILCLSLSQTHPQPVHFYYVCFIFYLCFSMQEV